MNNIPSFDKLNQLVVDGHGYWEESVISRKFGQYIDSLPWDQNRICFEKISLNTIEIDIYSSSDIEISEFVKKSTLSLHDSVAFVYQDNAPFLVIPFNTLVSNLDRCLTYSGDAMAFGFSNKDNVSFDDFLIVNAWNAIAFEKTMASYSTE